MVYEMVKNKKLFALAALALISLPVLAFADGNTLTLANPLAYTTIKGLLSHVLEVVRDAIGAIATIMLIVAGMLFLSSGGNQERFEKAKKAFLYAIIGIVLVIISQALLDTVYWIAQGTTPPNP